MRGRILDVNAFTTLDHVDAAARGRDWTDEGPAVLDVGTPEDAPEEVVVDLELDPGALEHVTPHVDSVRLSAAQAGTLAEALLAAVEDDGSDGGRGR